MWVVHSYGGGGKVQVAFHHDDNFVLQVGKPWCIPPPPPAMLHLSMSPSASFRSPGTGVIVIHDSAFLRQACAQ